MSSGVNPRTEQGAAAPPDLAHCHRCGACVCEQHNSYADDTLEEPRRLCGRCMGAAAPPTDEQCNHAVSGDSYWLCNQPKGHDGFHGVIQISPPTVVDGTMQPPPAPGRPPFQPLPPDERDAAYLAGITEGRDAERRRAAHTVAPDHEKAVELLYALVNEVGAERITTASRAGTTGAWIKARNWLDSLTNFTRAAQGAAAPRHDDGSVVVRTPDGEYRRSEWRDPAAPPALDVERLAQALAAGLNCGGCDKDQRHAERIAAEYARLSEKE